MTVKKEIVKPASTFTSLWREKFKKALTRAIMNNLILFFGKGNVVHLRWYQSYVSL